MNFRVFMRAKKLLAVVGISIFGFAAEAQPRRADLSRLVAIGDSLSAGVQNFSLFESGQVNGYANLIARQANTTLVLPLIAEPGIPSKLILNPAPPPIVIQAPGVSTGRLDANQATNLAVPGHTVFDALFRRPGPVVDPVQVWTNLVLGVPTPLPGQEMSQIEKLESFAATPSTAPTTVVVWLGSNDALFALLLADPAAVTPVPVFASLYGQVLSRVAATGAAVVVGNVPDVTDVPFLTAAPQVVEPIAQALGLPAAAVYGILGLSSGDYLVPGGVQAIQTMVASGALAPLPAICPAVLPAFPVPGTPCFLTPAQISSIQATVASYNSIISATAATAGAAVVDIHSLLAELSVRGYVVNGRRLTTAFLGGLFSLDGVHPSNTGYAIIANEFIRVLNSTFAAGIPPVVIGKVSSSDPLVLPGAGQTAAFSPGP